MSTVSPLFCQALVDQAPNAGMRNISLAFALDFETLRQTCQFPYTEPDFTKNFERYECLHYAPQFDFIMRPYSRNTTRGLLFVAGGYLTIPLTMSKEAIEFGLRLCSHLFFTQPEEREYEQVGLVINKKRQDILDEIQDDEDDDESTSSSGDEKDDDDDEVPFAEVYFKKMRKERRRMRREKREREEQQEEKQNNDDSNNNKKKKRRNLPPPSILEVESRNVEVFYDEFKVDRLAKIPICVDVALHLVSLCNNRLLSDEAIQHFKMLKENDAFHLCCAERKVRYGDVPVWAIHIAHDQILKNTRVGIMFIPNLSARHEEEEEEEENNNNNNMMMMNNNNKNSKNKKNNSSSSKAKTKNNNNATAAAAAAAAKRKSGIFRPLFLTKNSDVNEEFNQKINMLEMTTTTASKDNSDDEPPQCENLDIDAALELYNELKKDYGCQELFKQQKENTTTTSGNEKNNSKQKEARQNDDVPPPASYGLDDDDDDDDETSSSDNEDTEQQQEENQHLPNSKNAEDDEDNGLYDDW